MSNNDSLLADNIAFSYGRHRVLEDITLKIQPSELLALLGVNGAGKSTLMRVLLGFEVPHAGTLELGGRPVATYTRPELARRIAYVPQAHTAPFPYSVREVVQLGRIAHGGFMRPPTARDRDAVDETLALLGISHLAERAYTTLSGGERQLTLIARALTQEARLLILDEPTSALDYGNQIRLLDQMRRLADAGYGILFTTHQPEHVLMVADRAALLMNGRIAANGTPPEVLNPESLKRLYGVDVEWFTRAGGDPAFWPILRKHPADHAAFPVSAMRRSA